MFTGIIEETGKIVSSKLSSNKKELTLTIETPYAKLRLGESIAVEGVCLTVIQKRTHKAGTRFTANVAEETLNKTTLATLKLNAIVNLERSLKFSDRFGGHVVQGHVDATGRIENIVPAGNSKMYRFSFPKRLEPYILLKGSVAVNGISLTVAELGKGFFECAILKFTERQTSLCEKKVKDTVNLEPDYLTKIVASQVQQFLKQFMATKNEREKKYA